MSKQHIYDGPISLKIWQEDGGKLNGLSWGCPPGGCREWRGNVTECPNRGHFARTCNDTAKCRAAMKAWAVNAFAAFAQLYRERA